MKRKKILTSGHFMYLKGKRGKDIFNQILNAPPAPLDRLKKEADIFEKEYLLKHNRASK